MTRYPPNQCNRQVTKPVLARHSWRMQHTAAKSGRSCQSLPRSFLNLRGLQKLKGGQHSTRNPFAPQTQPDILNPTSAFEQPPGVFHVRMLLPNNTQLESSSKQLAAGIMLQPLETRMNRVFAEEQIARRQKTRIYKTHAIA